LNKFYYELIVTPDSYYELFLDLITSLVDEAIEETDETIIVRSEDSLVDIEAGVLAFADELSNAFGSKIVCKTKIYKKENVDWIKKYQDSVQPVEVGEFYIHPSWKAPCKSKKNILIDPTLSFGSGHHETTSTCLQMISKYVKPNCTVLDVGCGSGILSIASTKLGATVDICDTDLVAVDDSVNNFKANGVKCNSCWEGSANKADRTYDVVIANIVADVLVMINKDLKKVTNTDGLIILSGIMDKYKTKVLSKFEECVVVDDIQKNGWITLVIKVKG
jgi:ribosomal protein L11 methyltransferase